MQFILFRGICRRHLVFSATPRVNLSVDPNLASGMMGLALLTPSFTRGYSQFYDSMTMGRDCAPSAAIPM